MGKKLPPLDPRNGVSATYDEVIERKKPPLTSWSDVRSAFGEDAVNTGTVNLDLSTPQGRANRGKLQEMVSKHMKHEAVRGATRDAAVETVRMRNAHGNVKDVPQRLAEKAEGMGLRVAPKRKPNLRFHHGNWYRLVRGEWLPDGRD